MNPKLFPDGCDEINACGHGDACTPEDSETAYVMGLEGREHEFALQSHVHEYLGSTQYGQDGGERHNHRFAGMSGEAVFVPGSHVHRLETKTDYYGHYHELRVITGPAVYVFKRDASASGRNDRKHIHFVEGWTSQAAGHRHEYEVGTLIEAPMLAKDF